MVEGAYLQELSYHLFQYILNTKKICSGQFVEQWKLEDWFQFTLLCESLHEA